MRKTNTKLLTTIAICIAINCLGSFVAVATKIPLLLDHIGSIMVVMLFGWKYAVVTAFLSSVMNQIMFDPFALPFAPTGMLMVFMVGILHDNGYFKKFTTVGALLLAVIPGAILGAIIQGYIFGGVTSSGSDVIVRFMINMGVNPAVSSLVNQYFMEFFDRLISFTIVSAILRRINAESLR
ncbi:ECF transporter S component [uncultured Finegoldia sp.]|uniref:ECF transporter S component n=1 Tax=uncultured Finegoldia sp. TaxID=328009 RepID=UPI00262136FD|nr:ECF transporter S component [uncultured Finegoldia sp.]